jgi:hypothetical protein
MTVGEHADEFFGLPIVNFQTGDPVFTHTMCHRLVLDYDAKQTQRELLAEYLGKARPAELRALVIGSWGEGTATGEPPDDYLEGLIAAKLPRLAAIFVADVVMEEAEISWINQSNYTAFLAAYPDLEALRIRGGTKLVLPQMQLAKLRELTIETGGLDSSIVQAIGASKLPALKRLELWLGDDNYGFDGDLTTYRRMLEGIDASRLEYLGLRNAMIADELATWLATQPWLGKLHTLDLSMGTLSDAGANALLASKHLGGLKVLNLEHHYVSDKLVAKLKALPLRVTMGAAEKEYDPGERYVAVSE